MPDELVGSTQEPNPINAHFYLDGEEDALNTFFAMLKIHHGQNYSRAFYTPDLPAHNWPMHWRLDPRCFSSHTPALENPSSLLIIPMIACHDNLYNNLLHNAKYYRKSRMPIAIILFVTYPLNSTEIENIIHVRDSFPMIINQTGPNRIIANTVIDLHKPLTMDSGIVKILQLAMHYGQQPKKQMLSQENQARLMSKRGALHDDKSSNSVLRYR